MVKKVEFKRLQLKYFDATKKIITNDDCQKALKLTNK